MAEATNNSFFDELVKQIRAIDAYGAWENITDEDLITKKYIKTKDQLKKLPLTADPDPMVIQFIRLYMQALSLAFESRTRVMASSVLDMSHEGFGRGCVFANSRIIVIDKYFRDCHRWGFASLEKLHEENEKILTKAIQIW